MSARKAFKISIAMIVVSALFIIPIITMSVYAAILHFQGRIAM